MAVSAASSVELLASAQTPAGSFPASTAHEVYQYAWLRDGSWCAYALQRAGRAEAATAWHRWVARTLLAHRPRFDEAITAVRDGRARGDVMMPARFTLDGHDEDPGDTEEEWPNFQTDCYGFWLWALADHVVRGGDLDQTLVAAAELVIRYLLVAGEVPSYDCWEENPGNVHTASLAAVAAGLRDAAKLVADQGAQAYAARLVQRITGPEHTLAGAFVRCPGDTRVDGSLLWGGGVQSGANAVPVRYRQSMAMNLRLTDSEAAALRARADQEGRSMQEVARAAIAQYVSERPERLRDAIERVRTEDRELLARLGR